MGQKRDGRHHVLSWPGSRVSRPGMMSGDAERGPQRLADGSVAAFNDGHELDHVSKLAKNPIIALARRPECSAGYSRNMWCTEPSSVLLPLPLGNGWDDVK